MNRQIASGVLIAMVAAMPAFAANKVGVTSAISPKANTYSGATLREVRLGDNVIHNQRFETDAKGVVQILLVDGSSFTVGPRSSLVIDKFVYDPNKGTATLAASTTRGVMRFIGGAASKPGGKTTVKTPVGTAGIRGAVVDLRFPDAGEGEVRVDLHYGDEVWFECLSGKTASLTQPGSSALITLEGNGCGQIAYRDDLPPLQPGTVTDSQTPPLQSDGLLAENPSGLAGFSGAPMDQELPRGGLGDDGSDDILPTAQEAASQDAVAAGIQMSGDFTGFLSGLQWDSEYAEGYPLSLGKVELSVRPGTSFAAGFAPYDWGNWQADATAFVAANSSSEQLVLNGSSEDFSNGLIDYAHEDGAMSQSDASLCGNCKVTWGRWDGSEHAYLNEQWGNYEDAYWIVGQMATWDQLPTDVFVTYSGTAVGTLSAGGELTDQIGRLEAGINFASGGGYLEISDFGGYSFRDDYLYIYESGESESLASFRGWLSDSSYQLEAGGEYEAALGVDKDGNPIGTLFGSFRFDGWDAEGEYISAAGVFAGQATSSEPVEMD